jgi:uncharacterized protein YgiM (DUF1202 family)
VSIVLRVAFAVVAVGLAGCESTRPPRGEDATAAQAVPAPAPAAPAPEADPPEQTPMESARALYIKASLANFREAPGTSGRILAVLRKGTRVDVLEARNQWYRVRLADGREGWVAESVTTATPE